MTNDEDSTNATPDADGPQEIKPWQRAVAIGSLGLAGMAIGSHAWMTSRQVKPPSVPAPVENRTDYYQEPTMEALISRARAGLLANETRDMLEEYYHVFKTSDAGLDELCALLNSRDYLAASLLWQQGRHDDTVLSMPKSLTDLSRPDELDTRPTVECARMQSMIGRMITALCQHSVRERIEENPEAMFEGMEERLVQLNTLLPSFVEQMKQDVAQQQAELANIKEAPPYLREHIEGRLSQSQEKLAFYDGIEREGGVADAISHLVNSYKEGDNARCAKIASALMTLFNQQTPRAEEQLPDDSGQPVTAEAKAYFALTMRMEAIDAYMKSLAQPSASLQRR